MKKTAFILLIIMTTFLTAYAMQIQGGTKEFVDILQADPDQITEISLTAPLESNYNSTTDDTKIQAFIAILHQHGYKKIQGEPAYLPMKAVMIYLYENDNFHYIVLFENKLLINETYYEITNGEITNKFLTEYYHSLE